ncbi:MAG: hypothetical protein U1A78_22570 [Polyangia bacterium]
MRVKLLFALVAATVPFSASAAENCTARYTTAFAALESSVSSAASQAGADAQVENLFGPRPGACEDGAYEVFLNGFERFARKAVRDAQPRRQGKNVLPPAAGAENSLRLAIAAIRKSPVRVSPKDGKTARTSFLQVRSNINAVADDAGLTPMMQQLLDTIASVGVPPAAAEEAPHPVASGSPGAGTGTVQAIRIPLQPMPTWAIIKLYEMRDNLKSQDTAAVQIKLQDIINWIESTTQNQQQ